MLPWALVLTSAWLVGGAYLDGWAHSHEKVDSFFTVWHAVLYSGYAATATVLLGMLWRHRPTGRSLSERVPSGYRLSMVGAVVFGAAGVLDMGGHLVFGIEIGTAALLSPTHLLLFLAGGLMVAGPLCAAWQRPQAPRGWSGWLPVLASLTFVYAISNFATQFAHPLVLPAPGTFASYLPGGTDIQIVGADGGAQTRLPRHGGIDKRQPSWSPDGTRLAVVASDRENHTVALSVVNLPAGDEHVVLSADDRHAPMMPKWSPDGEVLAFVAPGNTGPNVHVARTDGSEVRQVTTGGVEIAPHPGAAASLLEGLEETLTVTRLGLSPSLLRTFKSTNPVQSMISVGHTVARNVKRWRDGRMVLRWTAAGLHEAEKQFRRVNGYREMRILRGAVERHYQRVASARKVA